jgi:uncharacterized cupin superfamily protein
MTTSPVPLFKQAAAIKASELADWGPVSEPLGTPVSQTSGKLLAGGRGEFPEAGYWRCTEGSWRCVVDRTEFCHFLEGACTYTADSGETIEIAGGDTAWFPAGWSGRCQVHKTIAKVFVIL